MLYQLVLQSTYDSSGYQRSSIEGYRFKPVSNESKKVIADETMLYVLDSHNEYSILDPSYQSNC